MVATCWVLLAQVWKWSNLSQQHPTCRNRVAKSSLRVAPSNVAICCVSMLRSFGRGFKLINWLHVSFGIVLAQKENREGLIINLSYAVIIIKRETITRTKKQRLF